MATGGAPLDKCCVCEDVVATALCQDCGDMLCASCTKVHAQLTTTKHHTVHDVSSPTSESLDESEVSVSALQGDLSEAVQQLEQARVGVSQVQASANAAANATPSDWLDFIKTYYPEYLERTHCVPPVHFNRVAYQHAVVAGQPVLVTQPVGGDAAFLPDPNQPAAPEPPRPRSARQRLASVLPRWLSRKKGPSQKSSKNQSSPSAHGLSTSATQGHSTSSPHSLWVEPPPLSQPLQTVQESDVRDDFAQQHVLHNLHSLGVSQGEVMFLLSQLVFKNYLNQPCYAATASLLPKPADLGPKKDDGEFDVLLIHRNHGVLIGEIKSVGLFSDDPLQPVKPPSDVSVAKRVRKAARQLEKSGEVVEHLLKDVAPGVTIKKTVFLPYVARSQLLRILQNDLKLQQDVCNSVGAHDAATATQLCVCSEDLSERASPWRMDDNATAALTHWWRHRLSSCQDAVMSDDRYLSIIARFVGPATTVSVPCVSPPRVEVRTRGQAVAELGRRVARLVITPRQLDILTRPDDHVALVGPPGTGKSLMLGLTGLRGLREGRDVHVMSIHGSATLAASHLLLHQLQQTVASDPALRASNVRVELHEYSFSRREKDVQRAINDLVAASRGRQLCILVDEIVYLTSSTKGARTQRFVAGLVARLPSVRLWTACFTHNHIPAALHVEALTLGLRSAPAVLREVVTGASIYSKRQLHPYSNVGIPSPADGPDVLHLHHDGDGHTGDWPDDCVQCGSDLAEVFSSLGVGASANPPSPNAPAPLQYRDVFVLTRSDLREEIRDASTGLVTREASGVARGLRLAGVPVLVTGGRSKPAADVDSDLRGLAVARNNEVTVTYWGCVRGLERRVVVWLHGRWEDTDDGHSDENVQALDRVELASRCTTQLIVVHKPGF